MANNIGSTLESWKSIDFISLLKDLDTIASEIANEKDLSDSSRRLLIEKNKKFKEQVSLETRREVGPLLKSFQNEVDQLNKRNKTLETQLLTLYKKLIDLPDPSGALECAIANQRRLQKSQEMAVENKRLRDTLEEYQREFSSVKNQEVTVKQLRDRVKELESGMAASVAARSKEVEREISTTFAEKERELQQHKLETSLKLTECEKKLSSVEKNFFDTQSELFTMKTKFDELTAARSSEIDLLVVENERANERMKQLEAQSSNDEENRDNLVLLKKLKKLPDVNEMEVNEINDLQMELHAKDNEILKLSEEIRNLNINYGQNEKRLQNEIEKFENDILDKNKTITKLEEDLNLRRDYEEIKKELNIIKSIEFQDLDQTSVGSESPSSITGELRVPTKSIEQLLNEKSRRLQNDLLQTKASFTQSQIELSKMKEENNEYQLKINEKNQLIKQLEDDLHSVKTFQSLYNRKIGDNTVESSQNSVTDVTGQSNKANEANILADVLENTENSLKDPGQNSLLQIVQSQRDRFKIRSQELESNAQVFQQTIQNLQTDNDRLRADNAKLFEKVRFLQSYSGTSKTRFEDSTFSRYSKEYEANINPFETFNKHEKQRQYQALPPHEKVVLSLGKFVMGNRTARLFAFLYSLLMHFLIFVVLYKLAYTETCVRDQALQCRKEFAEHMKNVHGR